MPYPKFILLLFALFLTACSTTKVLEEGDLLYTGSEVTIEAPDTVTTAELRPELQRLFAPNPNRSLLGLPFRLYFYNLFDTGKEKGLWAGLQKSLGEPPVLYDPQITRQVRQLMANQAVNRGFFDPRVRSRLDTQGQKARVEYRVRLNAPYRISQYRMDIEQAAIREQVAAMPPSPHLQVGQVYDLSKLKAERQRIENWMRRRGYFFFKAGDLKFLADSISGQREVRLRLTVKESTAPQDLKQQRIETIDLYPEFNFRAENAPTRKQTVEGINFFFREGRIEPKPLLRASLFSPGDLYNTRKHERSQERLVNLPFYQFVNLRFEPLSDSDSLLRLQVFLTPRKQQSIEGSAGLTYQTTRFIGPQVNLTYTNRNIFKGAELLRLSGDGSFNFPLDEDNNYFQEIEGSGELVFPGLMLPFVSQDWRDDLIRAGTSVKLSYTTERVRFRLKSDRQDAATFRSRLEEANFPDLAERVAADSTTTPFIGLNEFELTFGYQWQRQRTIANEFNPFHFRYQQGRFQTPELRRLFLGQDLPQGQYSDLINLEQMLIFQPEFIFTFDSRRQRVKRHNYFYRGRIAFALNGVLEEPGLENLDKADLSTRFAQMENDLRYYWRLGSTQTIASRLIGNFSYPLGNEVIMPFFDYFTAGGPNDLRAYTPRQIGPGARDPESGVLDFLEGKGNVKLAGSLEFRQKLGAYLEWAVFADAGNVWLFESTFDAEDTEFALDRVFEQMGFGVGTGFRIDISALVIRLDFAFPLTKPWLPAGNRWVGDAVDIGDPDWRSENLTFNLAFGYPF